MKDNKTFSETAYMDKKAGIKIYLLIWGILIFLTAVTVTFAKLNIGQFAILVCLAIAAVKSTLVLLYFMHLRYEQKTVIKILMPIVIVLLAIFIGLTYSDVISR
jgi:cytochrome c oxidase subunit IV